MKHSEEQIKEIMLALYEQLGRHRFVVMTGSKFTGYMENESGDLEQVIKLSKNKSGADKLIITYEEGKEDKGRFIIVTNNTNLISLKEFNYMMPLHLQWGWIYPDATSKSGPLKKVLITGHDVHFTPEGTRITIEFSDCSILLKNMQPNFAGQAKGFDKYVTSVLNGIPVGITFIDYDITREVREQVVAKRVILFIVGIILLIIGIFSIIIYIINLFFLFLFFFFLPSSFSPSLFPLFSFFFYHLRQKRSFSKALSIILSVDLPSQADIYFSVNRHCRTLFF